MKSRLLLSAADSVLLDEEAKDWGFNEYALVEAAGRNCAAAFEKKCKRFFDGGNAAVAAAVGSGGNGADALVMLRYWILEGKVLPCSTAVALSRPVKPDEKTPCSALVKSLQKMNVPFLSMDTDRESAEKVLSKAALIIDGIAGTGLKGELSGIPAETVSFINSLKEKKAGVPFIVSVDLPSGNHDAWKPGMTIVRADAVLSIEPQKRCLYNPPARIFAGAIIPVGGVFPSGLANARNGAELIDWDYAKNLIPPVKKTAYKHERGSAEIRAGAAGTTGAALIAARGAQACGSGLVRLFVDDGIYPVVASAAGGSFPGVMVFPVSKAGEAPEADAILLGPGWGRGEGRKQTLDKALELEKKGKPLVLDADALALASGEVFCGNAILTPHPGEFAALSGAGTDEVLSNPVPLLLKTAKEKNATIILKGHVMNIASADGRLAIVDGMAPNLATGGSGDLLAGFCAALAARTAREGAFDAYACASAAAALLIEAGKSDELISEFADPLEVAGKAAGIAGRSWLGGRE